MIMEKSVLGVKIDDVSMNEAISIVDGWLNNNGKHYIVTPNPEFLVTAKKNEHFKKILNNADLAIPDGVGLKLGNIKNTIAGVDLMEKLIELAAKKGYKAGLLGGKDGVAEKAAKELKKKYKGVKIVFVSGSLARSDVYPPVDLFFVALGHPKQEFWINENLPKIPVKVAMGVGGAFDYLSGNVPRAPVFMRKLGIEWLFRLIIQPWRLKRQLKLFEYIWLLTKQS